MLTILGVIIIILLLIYLPALRMLAGIIVVGGVVIVGGLLLYSNMEDSASKNRIKKSEIEIVKMRIANNRLYGRIRNKSTKYNVSSIRIKFTVRDVISDNTSEIVKEYNTHILENVPPQQARDFEEYVDIYSGVGKAHGQYTTTYDIVEITGK